MSTLDELVLLYEEFLDAEEIEDIEIVSLGEWEQDYKFQNRSIIVKFKDEFFKILENRSGSYHSDWYYGDTRIARVERHEELKPVITWKVIGDCKIITGE